VVPQVIRRAGGPGLPRCLTKPALSDYGS
jgi:hypothetical protein